MSTDIRTIALIGHQGSGKTTIAEALLQLTGAIAHMGSTTTRNTVLDFEPEEQERGGSVMAAFATIESDGRRIHIVDTPGEGSYIHEARTALRGVDGAVLVISAPDGVEVETERTFRFARELDLPLMIFVNKMDRDRANPDQVALDIEEHLGIRPVPIELPIGRESNFRGVVDLLANEARLFHTDGSGDIDHAEVPAELRDEVEAAREALTEAAAEGDDELLERYLETLELSQDEVLKGIEEGMAAGKVVPIIYGAASRNLGVHRMLEILGTFPSAEHATTRYDADGDKVEPDVNGPFLGQVIKTQIDPYAGAISVVRVLRGKLSTDAEVINCTRGGTERMGHLHWLRGKTLLDANEARPGDLVAVTKLKNTQTGDTLADKSRLEVMEGLGLPPSMTTLIVKPATRKDEDRMRDALNKISAEDPAFVIGSDGLTKETTVSGQTQIHVDMCLARLARKYKVNLDTELPPVPYRETIRGNADVEGKHKKQSGGRGQFGVAFMRIEPLPRNGGFEFVDQVKGGAIPRQYIPAVEKGIVGAMEKGVLAGYPVQDVRVTVYDGKYHAVDSSEAAFMLAGSKGFKAGFMKCRPTLLEPIMKMQITVPEDVVGDVMGDVGSRRGRLHNTDYRGNRAVITAYVPLAEARTYGADLRAMTQGKGTFTWELEGYEEVPPNLQQTIINEGQGRLQPDED